MERTISHPTTLASGDLIPGLTYIPNYLLPEEQDQLLAIIDQQPWLTTLKRRVQHYGYRYDYTRRVIDSSLFLGPLPVWAAHLAQRLHQNGFAPHIPDQLIVNEYEPGQGIASHIDCTPCFGDTILSISLGSACIMLFTHTRSKVQLPLLMEPRSLLILTGEARYAWKHGIPPRKMDVYQGQRIERQRRVSLTFRTVLKPVITHTSPAIDQD